jgi:hypothetical protein
LVLGIDSSYFAFSARRIKKRGDEELRKPVNGAGKRGGVYVEVICRHVHAGEGVGATGIGGKVLIFSCKLRLWTIIYKNHYLIIVIFGGILSPMYISIMTLFGRQFGAYLLCPHEQEMLAEMSQTLQLFLYTDCMSAQALILEATAVQTGSLRCPTRTVSAAAALSASGSETRRASRPF